MNIDKIGEKAVEAYVEKSLAPGNKTPPASTRDVTKTDQDKVSISKAAKELQEAQKAVQNAPDVRADRVAAIKKQIQEGTYQVPTEALADKLLSILKLE